MRTKIKVARADGRSGSGKARRLRRSTSEYLFVYGTLKRGAKSHPQLIRKPGVRFIGAGRIRGELYKLHDESYPAAIQTTETNTFVKGQLFALRHPQKTLVNLDQFEGVSDGLFRRELVDAWTRGRRVKAWVYFYARPLARASLVPNGIYSSR